MKHYFISFFVILSLNIAYADDYIIGIETSMKKVFIKNDIEGFTGQFTNQTSLSLAKNEFESFQLVVKANIDLSAVFVQSEGFGCLIVEAKPIGYVDIVNPTESFDESYKGWHPDPVLTYIDQVDIQSDDYQPFLITFYAPKDIEAKTYNGNLIVNASNSSAKSIAVQIIVWDFEIPDKPSLPTAMSWRGKKEIQDIYENTISWDEREQQAPSFILKDEYDFLIEKYRLFPDRIYNHTTDHLLQYFNEKGWIDFSNWENGPIHLNYDNGEYYVLSDDFKSKTQIDEYMDSYIERLKREFNDLPSQMQPYVFTYVLDEEPMEFKEIAKEKILKELEMKFQILK